jgi:hypothetical protein
MGGIAPREEDRDTLRAIFRAMGTRVTHFGTFGLFNEGLRMTPAITGS